MKNSQAWEGFSSGAIMAVTYKTNSTTASGFKMKCMLVVLFFTKKVQMIVQS